MTQNKNTEENPEQTPTTPNKGTISIPQKDIERDLKGLTITIGDIPTRAQYENCGKYNILTMIRRLRKSNHRSWYKMLEEIGYEIDNRRYRFQQATTQEVIEDLQQVDEEADKMLSSTYYTNNGTYPMSTIQTTLDETQWNKILKKADIFNPDDHPYSP